MMHSDSEAPRDLLQPTTLQQATTPRGRVWLRNQPGTWVGTRSLLRGEDEGGRLLALQMLGLLLQDIDASLESGFRGFHSILAKLASSGHSAATSELAADVIGACVAALPLGRGFPVAPALDSVFPPPPMRLSLLSFLHAEAVDSQGSLRRYSLRPPALRPEHLREGDLCLLTRMVPGEIRRQTGQDDVGQVCWPAGPVLARWAVAHRALLARRRMCELGSGVGLSGIAAGLIAALEEAAGDVYEGASSQAPLTSCLLTDFNPVVLQNLSYNASLNEPCCNGESLPGAAALLCRCGCSPPSHKDEPGAAGGCVCGRRVFCVRPLDWFGDAGTDPEPSPPSPQNNGTEYSGGAVMDVILGSDIICKDADAYGIAAALRRMLRRPEAQLSSDDVAAASATGGAAAAAVSPKALSPHPSALQHSMASMATLSVWGSESVEDCGGGAGSDAHGIGGYRSPSGIPGIVSPRMLHQQHQQQRQESQPRFETNEVCASPPPLSGPPRDATGDLDPFRVHGGFAVILAPLPRTRYGVDKLAPALTGAGLRFSVGPVHPSFVASRHCGGGTAGGAPGGGGGEPEDTVQVTAGGLEAELQQWVVTW